MLTCSLEDIEWMLIRFDTYKKDINSCDIPHVLREWMQKIPNPNRYANHKDELVRAAVAETESRILLSTLRRLSRDPSAYVRLIVANNPVSAESVLINLYKDTDENVRAAVAENPNVTIEMIPVLAEDPSILVCTCVVKQPKTSQEIIENIANKYLTQSREKLRSYSNGSGKSEESELFWLVYALAENPKTPIEFLRSAVKIQNKEINEQIAWNPNAPSDVLDEISSSSSLLDNSIHYAIAQNPNSSNAALEEAAWRREEDIDRSLLKRPQIPVGVLEIIKFFSPSEELRQQAQKRLQELAQ